MKPLSLILAGLLCVGCKSKPVETPAEPIIQAREGLTGIEADRKSALDDLADALKKLKQ
jgi:hypothetical protein